MKSKPKVYFYDNGIRNAIIGQFNPLNSRQDAAARSQAQTKKAMATLQCGVLTEFAAVI
ncbi:hypothetical protein [Parapedobacter composti]|uniref:hypothetical protein n=1 Tax=Parapedobacter composti TaxID=623281 RepID=UPI000AD8CE2C|nr:hypothetical protein [Parapedobacter composti]